MEDNKVCGPVIQLRGKKTPSEEYPTRRERRFHFQQRYLSDARALPYYLKTMRAVARLCKYRPHLSSQFSARVGKGRVRFEKDPQRE
ncbi:hypothetical protein CDAR_293971 [Caerostris darwini]|uniref:Uncharacterized protein n=1 Tax=Caerostris darwini TaxID=1538125 RepID=A0AAV4VF26_9ARAC|nr:hypothetical protein CDAR_293971 [Caerostris darwini]